MALIIVSFRSQQQHNKRGASVVAARRLRAFSLHAAGTFNTHLQDTVCNDLLLAAANDAEKALSSVLTFKQAACSMHAQTALARV
jgi:hypothetical protein